MTRLVLSLLALFATAPAQQAQAILATVPVKFPAYESYRGIARYAPTRDEYVKATGDSAFVMERVRYRSDDLAVFAYLCRPVNVPATTTLLL